MRGGKRPRIVLTTAKVMQVDREDCLAKGVDGYLTKRIRVDGLAQGLLLALPASRSGSA